jgi:hypothetical protein
VFSMGSRIGWTEDRNAIPTKRFLLFLWEASWADGGDMYRDGMTPADAAAEEISNWS